MHPEELKTKYKMLGLISVLVWRKRLLPKTDSSKTSVPTQQGDLGIIPEKALKGQALTLSAGYVAVLSMPFHPGNRRHIVLPDQPC